jgi:hypothetical protein
MNKDILQEIITKVNPKGLTKYINARPEFKEYIDSFNIGHTSNHIEKIYLILNNPEYICKNNKKKSFKNLEEGYRQFCDTGKKCPCRMENQVEKIKESWANKTEKQKIDLFEKQKKTCLEKYGVDNPLKSKEIRQKAEKTYKENTGYQNPLQNPEVIQKIKNDCFEKYGVEYPFQNKEIRDKTLNVQVQRYGSLMSHARTKMLEMYLDNPFTDEGIKKKIVQYNQETFGVSHVSQRADVKERKRQTSIDNYGVDSHTKRHYSYETLKILENKELLKNTMVGKSYQQLGYELGVADSTVKRAVIKHELQYSYSHKNSVQESEITDFLKEHDIKYLVNDRSIISPLELDIVIPSKNVAIEFCGVYWHSDRVNPNIHYHYNKLSRTADNGYKLITIFENEWNYNRDYIKSIILNSINYYNYRDNIIINDDYEAYIGGKLVGKLLFDVVDDYVIINEYNYYEVNSRQLFGLFINKIKQTCNPNSIEYTHDNRYPSNYCIDIPVKQIIPVSYWWTDNKRLFNADYNGDTSKMYKIWDCGKIIYRWQK